MSQDKFSLPCSSITELEKIVKGYSHIQESADLDGLSKLLGMNKTVISGNNLFLTQTGIITTGKKKGPTELGRKLGRALEHNQVEDSKSLWQEIIKSNEFLSNLVTTIRLKNGMSAEEFTTHILYVSGLKKTKGTNTGARTVTDMILLSGLVKDQDGKLYVSAPISPSIKHESGKVEVHALEEEEKSKAETGSSSTLTKIVSSTQPSIAINIQLQLPETENPQVYENLFKALRKHLFPSNE